MGYIAEALYALDLLEDSRSRSAINSNMIVLLTHMLKCIGQPEYQNKGSWRNSIKNSYKGIISEFIAIGKGAVYKNFYMRQLDLDNLYRIARQDASDETGKDLNIFPDKCPWTKNQLVDFDFITAFINTYGQDNKEISGQMSFFDEEN